MRYHARIATTLALITAACRASQSGEQTLPPAILTVDQVTPLTRDTNVVLSGLTEQDAFVLVQTSGSQSGAEKTADRWTAQVPLVRGRNTLEIDATAPGHSITTATVVVSRVTFLVVAHHGASALAPENTLAAVRLAWQQ